MKQSRGRVQPSGNREADRQRAWRSSSRMVTVSVRVCEKTGSESSLNEEVPYDKRKGQVSQCVQVGPSSS